MFVYNNGYKTYLIYLTNDLILLYELTNIVNKYCR